MRTVTIQCAGLTDARQLHLALAQALEFPQWYGQNLDALFDCLTEIGQPTAVRLENWAALGEWKAGFAAVFADAGIENPDLDIICAD